MIAGLGHHDATASALEDPGRAILARVSSIDYGDRRRRLLAGVTEWAEADDNVRVAILTGSAARDGGDALSDLDVELYVGDPTALLADRSWYQRFGTVLAVEELPNPGWHPTRLLYLQGGKIDFMIAPLAAVPGSRYDRPYRVLVDKDSLTAGLPAPQRTDTAPPTPEAFDTCANWFWAAAIMSARCIVRADPWAAKFRDWDLKVELLKMIEWDHRARYGWDYDTRFNGKNLDPLQAPRHLRLDPTPSRDRPHAGTGAAGQPSEGRLAVCTGRTTPGPPGRSLSALTARALGRHRAHRRSHPLRLVTAAVRGERPAHLLAQRRNLDSRLQGRTVLQQRRRHQASLSAHTLRGRPPGSRAPGRTRWTVLHSVATRLLSTATFLARGLGRSVATP